VAAPEGLSGTPHFLTGSEDPGADEPEVAGAPHFLTGSEDPEADELAVAGAPHFLVGSALWPGLVEGCGGPHFFAASGAPLTGAPHFFGTAAVAGPPGFVDDAVVRGTDPGLLGSCPDTVKLGRKPPKTGLDEPPVGLSEVVSTVLGAAAGGGAGAASGPEDTASPAPASPTEASRGSADTDAETSSGGFVGGAPAGLAPPGFRGGALAAAPGPPGFGPPGFEIAEPTVPPGGAGGFAEAGPVAIKSLGAAALALAAREIVASVD